jgi:hypothetical protein
MIGDLDCALVRKLELGRRHVEASGEDFGDEFITILCIIPYRNEQPMVEWR